MNDMGNSDRVREEVGGSTFERIDDKIPFAKKGNWGDRLLIPLNIKQLQSLPKSKEVVVCAYSCELIS